MNSNRYRHGDLRASWTQSLSSPRRFTHRGKAAELVTIAWAHFAKAVSRKSPAAQLALETMQQAERVAAGHGTAVETLLWVGTEGNTSARAVRALP